MWGGAFSIRGALHHPREARRRERGFPGRVGGFTSDGSQHPEIRVKLEVARDEFRAVDHVTKAMRRAGIQQEEIEEFWEEALSAEDRDLLQVCGRWVTLKADIGVEPVGRLPGLAAEHG